MPSNFLKTAIGVLLAATSLLVWTPAAFAQSKCLTDDEVKSMVARVGSKQDVAVNNKLKDELLKLKVDNQKLFQKVVAAGYKDDAQLKELKAARSEDREPKFRGR